MLVAVALLTLAANSAAADSPEIAFSPVYRIFTNVQAELFVVGSNSQQNRSRPAFLAVSTNVWISGLVPIFAFETAVSIELRRRPPRGQENVTEPLFFALPCEDESVAAKVAGTWECRAVREDRSKAYVVWELGVADEKIFGRFDQNTEYRFASITGGSLQSKNFNLRVEYVKDGYLLTGKMAANKASGEWRREDNSEHGTWEASRSPSHTPRGKNIIALYEWRRASNDARRYAVQGEQLPPNWERSARPLCRVWRD